MARINTTIGDDYFELVRDKIAAILLDEMPNQADLQNNEDLRITEIWRERTTNFNLNELPAINLSVSELPYAAKWRGDREADPLYFIDIYLSKVHTDADYADRLSKEGAWKMARVIQYILDHDEYKDLQMAPHIRHTEVRIIRVGEADTGGAGKCSVVRVEFLVETYSTTQPIDVLPFAGITTTVKLEETDEGHIYKTQ